VLHGGGRAARGDRRGGDDRQSLAVECWGRKVSGAQGGVGVAEGGPVRADVVETLSARGGGAAWPARGDGGRWRSGVAARGERGDEAATRAHSV
jgi:hypothetical protein